LSVVFTLTEQHLGSEEAPEGKYFDFNHISATFILIIYWGSK
jgi:hypothetical protein